VTMAKTSTMICIFFVSMVAWDNAVARTTNVQKRSTTCNDDGDCGDDDYCHFKWKKCRPGKAFK